MLQRGIAGIAGELVEDKGGEWVQVDPGFIWIYGVYLPVFKCGWLENPVHMEFAGKTKVNSRFSSHV